MPKITPNLLFGAYLCKIKPHSAKTPPSLNKSSKPNFYMCLGRNIYTQKKSPNLHFGAYLCIIKPHSARKARASLTKLSTFQLATVN